ncbi:MAG: hypothetical protein PHY30_00620 [Candidatus Pacebacteria bacterium]|nr:hypothetical protein [Candidatus Paceibacterota bacterium]
MSKKKKKQADWMGFSVDDYDVELIELIDQELIQKLDSLKINKLIHKRYSEIYRGGIYALSLKSQKENPDWMAQSANSFREIIYLLYHDNRDYEFCELLNYFLERGHGKDKAKKYATYINNLYKFFSTIAHHSIEPKEEGYQIDNNFKIDLKSLNKDTYFDAVRYYKKYLKILIVTTIELYQKIDDSIIKKKQNKKDIKFFLNNDNLKAYFFSKIDKNWLEWIWTNGFLANLKEPIKNLNREIMPELEYLNRVAMEKPKTVVKIIDSVKISKDNFNPEVINQFLRIMNILKAEQIKRLTKKIYDEQWIYLVRHFHKSGYEFTRMIKSLGREKEYSAIIELAQSLLIIKERSDFLDGNNDKFMLYRDEPFFVFDLFASGIFESLIDVKDNYVKKALKVLINILGEIIKLSEFNSQEDKNKGEKNFDYDDFFCLSDIDFFTLDIKKGEKTFNRKDLKDFIATIKKLIERILGDDFKSKVNIMQIFKYINDLPSCRLSWRLKLFTLAQRPKVFKKELKRTLFKIFEVINCRDMVLDAEYKRALKIAFPIFSNNTQRHYIKKVLSYFSEKLKCYPEQSWYRKISQKILSITYEHLTKEEIAKFKEFFGIDRIEGYVPMPLIMTDQMQTGFVIDKSPVEVKDYSVDQIVEGLKTEWTPERITEEFNHEDFFSPRNAEGLANALREDIKERIDQYIENINKFFDRIHIHPQYLYSILNGIEESLGEGRYYLSSSQIDKIIELFVIIKESGEEKLFKRASNNSWIVDWIEVHIAIADLLLYLLRDKKYTKELYGKNRTKIRGIVFYLLFKIPDPTEEYEKEQHSDLRHVAINSVRGKAFEGLVVFMEKDGKILADDIKEIYKKILSEENSLAVRFLIGRYLAFFYFKDREFIKGLFSKIFPINQKDKQSIYLATWEGYISNDLYDKLFLALHDYYEYAINFNCKDCAQREHEEDINKALAIHIANAFIHLGLDIKDDLFIKFWRNTDTETQEEFVSFIGRNCLSRSLADQWLKENNVSKEKLIKLWSWVLKNVSHSKVLSSFGFWINLDGEILNDNIAIKYIVDTLKKSNGTISWDSGLLRRLPIFAEKNPEKTLEIINYYFINSNGNLTENYKTYPLYEEEITKALEVIYNSDSPEIKQKVYNLINILIEKGGNVFLGFKKILTNF